LQRRTSSSRIRPPAGRRGGSIGIGVAAGAATAAGLMFGRKAAAAAKTGQGHPLKHRVLDLAASAIQPKYPLAAMSTYLNGFHMYADEMGRQVEASHFCIHLRHDLHQCVIFDRNAPDARLIGIEYIISAERFRGLPDDEKRLWHSHHYEVKSGELVAPGIPDLAEHAYFSDLVTTYGKTFHLHRAQAAEPGRHPGPRGAAGRQFLAERPDRADPPGGAGLQAVGTAGHGPGSHH
jgi:uncharacterized protein DUF1264